LREQKILFLLGMKHLFFFGKKKRGSHSPAGLPGYPNPAMFVLYFSPALFYAGSSSDSEDGPLVVG